MTKPLPFDGLRIVDLGSFWAAPYLTTYLGAYGADVIKVESIQRPDGFRFTGTLPVLGDDWYDRSLMWQATNLNKRGITLNLRDEDGKKLLRRLCESADVFVENYAARVVEQLGFDYDNLREINPRLIVLRLPGFGLEGPWRDYVGWGNAFEQLTGLAWVTGFPDGQPHTPGGYIDPTVGMHAAVALLAALEYRERTGEGQLVEIAQIEVGASLAAEQIIAWSVAGEECTRVGNLHTRYWPQGVYRCAGPGEDWVALSVRDDADWAALRRAVGDPPQLAAEELRTVAGRREHHQQIDAFLRTWFAERDGGQAVEALRAAGVPAAKALSAIDFTRDPQLRDRHFYQEVRHPLSGPRLFPRYPMRYSFESPTEGPHRRPAPRLGEHNEEVLVGELGLSKAEIDDLTSRKVIGTSLAAG